MTDSLEHGDYVLATKYEDGDPGDQFAVGFFAGMLAKVGGDRYLVVDDRGRQFRGNGFRRCEKISKERGQWLVAHMQEIEASMSEFRYDEYGTRHGRSVWDWAALPMYTASDRRGT